MCSKQWPARLCLILSPSFRQALPPLPATGGRRPLNGLIQLPGARLCPLEPGLRKAQGAALPSRAGRGLFLLWDPPAFSVPSCEDKRCPHSWRRRSTGSGPAHSPRFCQKPEGCWGPTELADGCGQDLGSYPQVPETQGRSHGRWSWRPADPAASGWLNLHF